MPGPQHLVMDISELVMACSGNEFIVYQLEPHKAVAEVTVSKIGNL